MARQTGPNLLSGITINGIIYYVSNGQYLMRAAPGRVRQTKATKRSATIFGKASKAAVLFYSAFRDLIPVRYYKLPLFNTCRSAVLRTLKEQQNGKPKYGLLENYNFVNEFSCPSFMMEESFCNMVNGVPVVKFPAFEPKSVPATPKTEALRFKIIALAIDIEKLSANKSGIIETEYPYNSATTEQREFKLPLPIEPGEVVFIGARIYYMGTIKGKFQELEAKGYNWTGIIKMINS